MSLPTNYKNEVLNSAMGNRRQYRLIENNNGTVSFIDVTVYDEEGSFFNADDINAITTAINLNITNIDAVQQMLQNGVVTGIKGSAETGNYRVGQVTINAHDVDTLTEAEIRALISSSSGINFLVVDELPTTNISTSTVYFVPSPNARSRNIKDEYVYIIVSNFQDSSDVVEIYPNYNSLVEVQGVEDKFYVTSDDYMVYEWNTSYGEFVESEYTGCVLVNELPSSGDANIIYLLSSDNKPYEWKSTGQWEQIGSTSVNLTNYYTKTEIDSGALISTAEFQAM